MKTITIAAATAALFAIPAAANAQAYVQVTGSYDNASYIEDVNSNGFGYGAAAGYELPISNGMFVGVEATVAGSTGKKCYGDDTARLCMKTGRDLAGVVRLGTHVGANSKLYVLGGYTNGRVTATYDSPDLKMKVSGNGDGLRLGAGFEQDLGHNMFGKIEYRYSNYKGSFSRNQAVAGFGIKF